MKKRTKGIILLSILAIMAFSLVAVVTSFLYACFTFGSAILTTWLFVKGLHLIIEDEE